MKRGSFLRFGLLCCFLTGFLRGAEMPLIVPSVPVDSPAHEAIEKYRAGHLPLAVSLARPLAEKGSADALFLIGISFESVEAPKGSRLQALDSYYRKAADAGSCEAAGRRWLVSLASADSKGIEKLKGDMEAAAKGGDGRTCRILGEAWLRGAFGNKASTDEAVKWWQEAGRLGDAPAFLLLARLCEGRYGFAEKHDLSAAVGYYRQAQALGSDDALIPLASLLLSNPAPSGDEAEVRKCLEKAIQMNVPGALAALGDAEQRLGRTDAAMDCYRRGADASDPFCMERLGSALLAAKDEVEGTRWLKTAADAGSSLAAARLGHQLVKQDPGAARHYLVAAAGDGIWQAQFDLGLLYLEGIPGESDATAAVVWLTESIKSRDPEACYRLALLNETGTGCPVNYANAGVLYTMACEKGHAASAARIAHMAVDGLGTHPNLAQAWAYASFAIERGDSSCKDFLASIDSRLDEAGRQEAEKAIVTLREVAKRQ